MSFHNYFLKIVMAILSQGVHDNESDQKSPSNVTHKQTQCKEGYFPENVCSNFSGCSASKYCTESCDKQTGTARCKPNCKTAVNSPGRNWSISRFTRQLWNQEHSYQVYCQEVQDKVSQNQHSADELLLTHHISPGQGGVQTTPTPQNRRETLLLILAVVFLMIILTVIVVAVACKCRHRACLCPRADQNPSLLQAAERQDNDRLKLAPSEMTLYAPTPTRFFFRENSLEEAESAHFLQQVTDSCDELILPRS